MSHVKTSDKQYVRDTETKALLNTDRSALERHRKQRADAAKTRSLHEQVAALTRRVEELESLIARFLSDGK